MQKKNVGFINTIIYCQRTSQVKIRGIITLNIYIIVIELAA